MADKIMNMNIVVDDGSRRVPIMNTSGEEIGTFTFHPTDIGILQRYNDMVDTFDAVSYTHLDVYKRQMLYSPNNASDSVSLSYGTAPTGGNTWAEASATPFALTSQTSNYYIYVAIVNAQTGKTVAYGKTQNVVGA